MSKASRMLESLNQYVNQDNIYKPATDTKKILTPGVYEIKTSMEGLYYEKTKINTDALIKMNQAKYNYLIEEITKFWESADKFKEMDMMNKRAFMLYSEPGTGKSCILKQVMNKMTEDGNITFICRDARTLVAGLKLFREVEESRKALVILEEVDEIVDMGGSKALADLLDGPDSVADIFYLGTTNYMQKIPERLLRPSRFDRKVKIDSPSKEDRSEYFRAKMKGKVDDKTIQEYVEATDGFTFADMKEFLVSVVCLGNDLKETVTRLKGFKTTVRETSKYRDYDDCSSPVAARSFYEALTIKSTAKLEEALSIREEASMVIELNRSIPDLLKMSKEDAHKWLEEVSGNADVKADPELTNFHVDGDPSGEFKTKLLDKLKGIGNTKVTVDGKVVLDQPDNAVATKEEPKKPVDGKPKDQVADDTESIERSDLGWAQGKWAQVAKVKGTDYIKKETHRAVDGNIEYVLYVSKDGKKLMVFDEAAHEMDDAIRSLEYDVKKLDKEVKSNPMMGTTAHAKYDLRNMKKRLADLRRIRKENIVKGIGLLKDESTNETHKDYTDQKEWEAAIKKNHPTAKISKEDGKSYGPKGSLTAHTGPDMQSDVVGTFVPEDKYGWCDESRGARVGTVKRRKSGGRYLKKSTGWVKLGDGKIPEGKMASWLIDFEDELNKLGFSYSKLDLNRVNGLLVMSPADAAKKYIKEYEMSHKHEGDNGECENCNAELEDGDAICSACGEHCEMCPECGSNCCGAKERFSGDWNDRDPDESKVSKLLNLLSVCEDK